MAVAGGGPGVFSRRGDCRLVGAHFGRWREETFGRARCLTLRYSLPLSVWVDSLAEHMLLVGSNGGLQHRHGSVGVVRNGCFVEGMAKRSP